MLYRLAVAVIALVLAGGAALADVPAKKVALVIGNARYTTGDLKNPVNDARAMAKALRAKGFEVILRENTTKPELESAIADFGEALTEGATALFYYAGHGIQVQGHNFLLPVDVKIASEQRVKLETVDVDVVVDQMTAAHTKVSMVVLDACRNNPFERRFRAVGGGLAQVSAPEGTFIAYATAPGSIAADGEGANGVYTQEILRAIERPGLKVEDVFKTVRVNVSRITGGTQVPWESSSLTGDFYFTLPLAGSAAEIAAARADLERERADMEREQAELARQHEQLQQMAARPSGPLGLADAQGSFSATLPASGRLPAVDAQITVQGHKVTGSGTPRGYPFTCNVTGDADAAAVRFTLRCMIATWGSASPQTFDSIHDGKLVRKADGALALQTTYNVVAQSGERVRGEAEWRKQEARTPDAIEFADAQGTFAGTLPATGRFPAVDVRIMVQGHKVTGYGSSTRSNFPCKVTGDLDQATIHFILNCAFPTWGGFTPQTFDSIHDGKLVRNSDGTLSFRTAYNVVAASGERLSGEAEWRKVESDTTATFADAQGTYAGALPAAGRFGAVTARLVVQGHKITGYGDIDAASSFGCKVIGEVDGIKAHFMVNCLIGNRGSGSPQTVDSIHDGALVRNADGTLSFRTTYKIVAQSGERLSGDAEWRKLSD